MLDFIERGLLIRRELQENSELTDKYRTASLTPGEWKNLGQVGDPMGLVAKNEVIVGLRGEIDAMVSLVHKLHYKPLGRINPGSAQYQRTGLQMITDWIGYFSYDNADNHVRYYDSTGIRNSGSRVEILSVEPDPDGKSMRIIVLKPSPEKALYNPSFMESWDLESPELIEWNQWEFGLKEGSTEDDAIKAFMLAVKGDPAEDRIKQAIGDGGIPFLYREPVGYEPGSDSFGRPVQYATSRTKAHHFGVVRRKPSAEQEVLTGDRPNVMEIKVNHAEAKKMFQRLVVPK